MNKDYGLPLLTVVVPVYNGREHIENTVKNILNTDYPPIELLLIDDGSTDDSSFLCRKLEASDKRLRYLRQENGGIAAARNKGLESAAGEYICFCDQDDLVEPFMYRKVVEHMIKETAPMGMCSTGRLIDGKKSGYEFLEDNCYRQEEILEQVLYPFLFRGYEYPFVRSNNYLYGTIWKCIYNRKFLMQNGIRFKCFVNFEDDWLFVLESLVCTDTLVTNSDTGYYWRVSSISESHKKRCIPDITERFKNLDNYVAACLEKRIREKSILREYGKIALCGHFEEGYRNAAYAGTKEEKRKCGKALTEYLSDNRYKEQLDVLKNLKKNVFRRRFLYGSLKFLGIRGTFFINRLLLFIEESGSKLQWLVALERKAKKKG